MNIKRIIAAFLAALCLSIVACDEKENGESLKTEQTTGTVTGSANLDNIEDGPGTFPDLQGTVENVKQYYSENVTFVFKADEYSDEVLMYTYGLMDDKFVEAVDDFVLSECDGMSADTFAIVKFKSGTDKTLIEEAAEVMKTEYVDALKNKLSAYNPEEFEASDGYQVKVYDDALMMVISSKNTEAILNAVGK